MKSGRGSRLEIVGTANEALRELDIDTTSPIDPIEAIRSLDLELGFFQLGKLLGAIVPERGPGTRAGVMLTTERKSSVQRFTAAHEIAHWYLDQDFLSIDLPLDTDTEVLGSPTSQRERDAQLFASHFLMPLPLLSRTASKYGLKRSGTASPVQAYSVARDMNVSYQAAVIHLHNCHFIANSNKEALLKVAPIDVKKTLSFGRKPTDSYGDVWSVRNDDGIDGRVHLVVQTNDDVVIRLPENRTTGHVWMTRSDFEGSRARLAPAPPRFGGGTPLVPPAGIDGLDRAQEVSFGTSSLPKVAEGFVLAGRESSALPQVGEAGERHLIVNAGAPGEWVVDLVLASPFDAHARVLDERKIVVNVHRTPEDEDRRLRLLEVSVEDEPA